MSPHAARSRSSGPSGSKALAAACTYSRRSLRASRSVMLRSRTNATSSARWRARASQAPRPGSRRPPPRTADRPHAAIHSGPRWRSSSSRIGAPIQVGMCTPLVTWPIGTFCTARPGHSEVHISRATSPWRRLTPPAARLIRSAAWVTPKRLPGSSRCARPSAINSDSCDPELARPADRSRPRPARADRSHCPLRPGCAW